MSFSSTGNPQTRSSRGHEALNKILHSALRTPHLREPRYLGCYSVKAAFVLLACALLAGPSPAQDLTDYGAVPALTRPAQDQSAANEKLDFHTDLFTGRFTYRIPIELPPARGGSQPAIALQYNSSAKNGWCGAGWDLEMG